MLYLNGCLASDAVVDIYSSWNQSEQRFLGYLINFRALIRVYGHFTLVNLAFLASYLNGDWIVLAQPYRHHKLAHASKLLWDHQATCVQMPQTEKHATGIRRHRVRYVAGVLRVLSSILSLVFKGNLQLEERVCWRALDVITLALIIPKKNFCKTISVEILIVCRDIGSSLRMLQANYLATLDCSGV